MPADSIPSSSQSPPKDDDPKDLLALLQSGITHNRDTNAAQNILRVGLEHQPLAEETLADLG